MKSKLVEPYLASIDDALKDRFQIIRKTILEAGPSLSQDIKWKNCLTYILGSKNLIQTVVGKDKISLIFHNGASIEDDSGLLEGDGKRTRTVRFLDDNIDVSVLSSLVKKSIAQEQKK